MEETGLKLIFHNRTAWFSRSVHRSLQLKWETNGGQLAHSEAASFVFSENPHEQDTKRLYMSAANADGCLAVFHASYIDACLQTGDMGKVCLGEYYLPPAEMIPAIKKHLSLKFAYELSDTKHAMKPQKLSSLVPRMSSAIQEATTSTRARTKQVLKRSFRIQQPFTSEQRLASTASSVIITSTPAAAAATSSCQQTTKHHHHHATSQHTVDHTSSKSPRRPLKSVQTRGTQLDSTPNVSETRTLGESPSPAAETPSVIRALEQTMEGSALAAWNYFRSPSIIGQTPCRRQHEPHAAPEEASSLCNVS